MKKFCLFLLLSFCSLGYSQLLIHTINLPSDNFFNYSYGLVYNVNNYWISSENLTGIKSVDKNGNYLSTININYPGIHPSQGLAFDGTNFWYVERKTARCDLFKISPSGTVLDSITAQQLFGINLGIYMGGAAWDGTGLWISLYYPNEMAALYKVDVTAKQIVDTIQVYGIQPTGITVKGDTLFYVMDGFEGDPENIYAVNLATHDTLFSWHVPEVPGAKQNPRGLAWDGSYFWLLAEPVGYSSGRQLFKYDVSGIPPETPELISPLNNSINRPLDEFLTWHSSLRTENYHLQISLDSMFTTILFEDSLIIDTLQNVTTLYFNSLYYWRVKAKSIVGYSNWSETWRFYTIVKTPELSLLSGSGQIILNWIQNPNNNISLYKIFRDTIPNPTSLFAIVDSNQFSYADTSFTENKWYYYRLKSVSIYNIESDFSNEVSGLPIETFQLAVYIDNNWNIVSIPGLLPYNQNVTSWWPGLTGNVFKFQGSYQIVTSVEPRKGYWMKHIGSNLYNTGEEWPAIGIQLVSHDPINATAGWNLIGGYEDTVATALITTTPPGLRTGPMFRYFDGYWIADYIEPGHGYWIKLTAAGQINIPSGVPNEMAAFAKDTTDSFGKIIITDNTGKSYTLYAANSEIDLSQYELPPLPPQGMFDIRYTSQRYVERLSSCSQLIEMTGVEHPVKVKVEGVDIILSDETGKEITRLNDGEEVILNTSVNKLRVTENIIPSVYSLEQNFPNPFNPNTTIRFSIPKEVQVNLTVYSILGEKVKELKNEVMKPGYFEIVFNASIMASGVYFYRIQAGDFVQTKKMILLK